MDGSSYPTVDEFEKTLEPLFLAASVLRAMEQDVKTTAASRLQDSQRGLGKVVREAELGRGQASVIVRLRALLFGAEHTSLFRVSSTDRATHGQYLSQRKWISKGTATTQLCWCWALPGR